MEEGFFSGNFDDLKNHWENEQRAEKFKSGGTRIPAIRKVLKRMNVDIHQHSWLDTGTGAGFIQTQVDADVSPVLFVGVDFSSAMLRAQTDPFGNLVIATAFKLPFRKEAFSVLSNIFSLSDYPEPKEAFDEFSRILSKTGNLYFVDYAQGDEYWELRKKLHGKTGRDNKVIVGDINLRNIQQSKELLPNSLRVVFTEIISYDINSDPLNSSFEIPDHITRKILFIQAYKPRSTN